MGHDEGAFGAEGEGGDYSAGGVSEKGVSSALSAVRSVRTLFQRERARSSGGERTSPVLLVISVVSNVDLACSFPAKIGQFRCSARSPFTQSASASCAPKHGEQKFKSPSSYKFNMT